MGSQVFTYILILDSEEALQSAVAQFAQFGGVSTPYSGRYEVAEQEGEPEGWIAVTDQPLVRDDYDPEELEQLLSAVAAPHSLIVEGRDGRREWSNEFLTRLKGLDSAFIDNDHGILAP